MSLAGASQQVTRRVTVLQSHDAVRDQVRLGEEARSSNTVHRIDLDVRAYPQARRTHVIFDYQFTTERGQELIIFGKSVTGEHVRVYVPSNPEEPVEAVLH